MPKDLPSYPQQHDELTSRVFDTTTLQSSSGHTNALAESFFAALKNELVHRTAFPTRRHAKRAIVSYIEGFYNRRRLHSALGYRTPLEVHTEYVNRQIAA